MAIRIIEGTDYAVLYCSTSMWAFGPVFEDAYEAREFLEWCNGDPRRWSDSEFENKYREFHESREKAPEPPPPALKLEMERDLKNAVTQGKIWGEFFDTLMSPRRS